VARVRSLREASRFVERAGLALVFPSGDVVLPSLWEAALGNAEVNVFVEEDGRRSLSPELELVWSLHDRLAAERLACAGKHLRNRLVLVSPAILPALYALTDRPGRADDFRAPGLLSPLELDLAEAILDAGPRTSPDLRRLIGVRDARRTKRALEVLQRLLVITRAGEVDQPRGWSAAVFDLTARRFRDKLRRIPPVETAKTRLAAVVLAVAGELSAADLAAVIGLTRADASATLDRLVDERKALRRDQEDFSIWVLPRRGSPRPSGKA
jgi:hypothetical protein